MVEKNISFKSISPSSVALNGEGYTSVMKELTDLVKDKNSGISPSDLLIYAAIKIHKNNRTQSAVISIEKLCKLTGYSSSKMSSSIKELKRIDAIDIEVIQTNNGINGRYITINKYIFPEDIGKYEIFTRFFIYNDKLSSKAKEFIILIQPYIMSRGSIIDMSNSKIAKVINMSRPKVADIINELKGLGYWDDNIEFGRYIDLYSIQMLGGNKIIQELLGEIEELKKKTI